MVSTAAGNTTETSTPLRVIEWYKCQVLKKQRWKVLRLLCNKKMMIMMTDRPDRAGSMDREAVAFGSSTLILPDTFLCSLCRQLDDKNGAVDEIGTWRRESCWHLDLAKNHDLDASAFNNNHHSSTLINQGASCIMHHASSIVHPRDSHSASPFSFSIHLRHSASPFSFSIQLLISSSRWNPPSDSRDTSRQAKLRGLQNATFHYPTNLSLFRLRSNKLCQDSSMLVKTHGCKLCSDR